MILKGRLGLIAKKVPQCRLVSDIGTDHAYIPIYLVSEGRCEKALALDVKQGPIEAAARNIKANCLEGLIETRIGDGLEPVKAGEEDVIIIAGMGGILIKDIINRAFDRASKANLLILQPMNAVEILREWLYKNGFEIIDEELEAEGSKLYNVMSVKWTGNIADEEEIFYYIGKRLVEKKDPLLERLLIKRIKQLDAAVKQMDNAGGNKLENRKKYSWLSDSMNQILNSLKA